MTTINAAAEIEAALADADIKLDVAGFIAMLRSALRSAGSNRVQADPRTQVTTAEQALLRQGGLAVSRDVSAYDRVRAETAAATAALLAQSLTTAEVAERLGVDPSRVRQLLAARQLLASRDGGEWRIPGLQFTGDRLVPNIGTVVQALPAELPLYGAATWLTSPDPDLEFRGQAVSPIEWLSAGGDPDRVSALAADL